MLTYHPGKVYGSTVGETINSTQHPTHLQHCTNVPRVGHLSKPFAVDYQFNHLLSVLISTTKQVCCVKKSQNSLDNPLRKK